MAKQDLSEPITDQGDSARIMGAAAPDKIEYLNSLSDRKEGSVANVERYLSDPDIDVRRSALNALSKLADPTVPSILVKIALADGDRRMRDSALDFLEDYRAEEIFKCLLVTAKDADCSVYGRFVVAKQLGSYDRPEAIAALIDLFDDTHYAVADRASESLYMLNRQSLYPFWQHAKKSRDLIVRARAKKALAELAQMNTKNG